MRIRGARSRGLLLQVRKRPIHARDRARSFTELRVVNFLERTGGWRRTTSHAAGDTRVLRSRQKKIRTRRDGLTSTEERRPRRVASRLFAPCYNDPPPGELGGATDARHPLWLLVPFVSCVSSPPCWQSRRDGQRRSPTARSATRWYAPASPYAESVIRWQLGVDDYLELRNSFWKYFTWRSSLNQTCVDFYGKFYEYCKNLVFPSFACQVFCS